MTNEKYLEVITRYRKQFEELNIPKQEYPHGVILTSRRRGLAHCHYMLDKMEIFIQEGRIDKVNRWLGFIQGFIWRSKMYTLNDLMNHNRP